VVRAGLEDDFVGSALDLLLRKYLTPSNFANSFSRLPDEGRVRRTCHREIADL